MFDSGNLYAHYMRISDIFESATLKGFFLRIDYKANHDVSRELLNLTHAKIALIQVKLTLVLQLKLTPI